MPRGKSYLKNEVLFLRSSGYSYELIRRKTGVSKSTLSNWLKNIPYKPNYEVLQRMKTGQIKSSETIRRLKINRTKEVSKIAKKELGKISKRDLMLLGIGLYIGEGSKYNKGFIQFSNSDPKVIKLAMMWFLKVLCVDVNNFRVRLHLYPDNEPIEAVRFWSIITGIPATQFGKIYIDTREGKATKNRKKLLYGTIHIRIRALGKKEFGVSLYQKILSWIEILESHSFAGIV